MQFNVEAVVGGGLLGQVLVEHDDDLRQVVEFGHCTHVVHGALPLFITKFVEDSPLKEEEKR